jgi:type III restriction enzyme
MSVVRLSLAGYQTRAVTDLIGVIERVARYHDERPDQRQQIALKAGAALLQSPTGSGKTLILGRVLESLRGRLTRPVVWFWFAPYAGLVTQTREALVDQCGSLRVRDVATDREPVGTRDGDVFIQTWATVAASNKDARKVRRTSESALSFDELIGALRSQGFFVGVVIDEAHLNFGASAAVAADFYLNTIQPDFTVLATATPSDEKLEAFEAKAGIVVSNRIVVPRDEVVRAGLNKSGLMLGVIRFKEGDQELIDHEQATLTAGWTQHLRIRERLAERGISVSPLMLVQVENDSAGAQDPVSRVRDKLKEIGVPETAIATHTSGEPDPDFHTLAYDPDKAVLIFKVAVATGFDAPRAWTLVSVRPNRGKDFGLQIVGRIMRVHPAVRPTHGQDLLLDRGYVFLTDPDMQAGLSAAVDELKAVQRSIELITDNLDVYQFAPETTPVVATDVQASAFVYKPPTTGVERQERLASLIDTGLVKETVKDLPPADQDRAIETGEAYQQMLQTPLFGSLPEDRKPGSTEPAKTNPKIRPYPLRQDIGLPKALLRELPPDPMKMNDLVGDIAREFVRTSGIVGLLQRKLTNAHLDLKDLFDAAMTETIDLRLRLSNARIAERAQLAFTFNDSIDPRLLKQAIIRELKLRVDSDGIDADDRDLRRALDLAGMTEPDKLKEAIKTVQGRSVRVVADTDIPTSYFGPDSLPVATKSAYGVFPDRLNQEERSFAEFLDADTTGTVKWWLRNPENETWATRLVLPSGHRFFPDFVVGVAGRATPDSIALVEIKDDGVTGRLQSDSNIEKIRVQHRDYRNVFWTYRTDGTWARAQYAEGLHRIVPKDRFDVTEMVYLT